MADCFVVRHGGGSGISKVQPVTLFEGRTDGYTLAEGLSGFSICCSPVTGTAGINKSIDATTDNKYGCNFTKSWSIDENTLMSPRIDSVVYSSNEAFDLTGHNAVCIEFYGFCDYNYSTDKMGAYFKIDKPETPVQSGVSYNWAGWDNMYMDYRRRGRYFFDVSQITGEHFLCFGIFHGTYSVGYTNGVRMYKMTLM